MVNDCAGFYTTRVLAPYMNEAAWALSEGVSIEKLDRALVDWGFPVGPITLLDEVGIDVGAKVAGIMEKAFGERVKSPDSMTKLLDDDRKGRKNSRGFYTYQFGKKAGIDASVYKTLGITVDPKAGGTDEELALRLVLQMVNEAAYCLEEGILHSARDGDVGAIFGLGFPPYTGGPFFWCDTVGADEVVEQLETLSAKYGTRFKPAQILVDYAKSGKKFRDDV